jgi:ribosomal protein S18 acetylase RimI-like enzyme
VFKLRKYRPTDLDRCVQLFIRVFAQPPWEDEWPSEERAKAYLGDIVAAPGFRGFVAYEGRQILGMCFGHIVHWWAGDEYYLDEFCVDLDVQRSGIGTALVGYAEEQMVQEGVHLVVLLTERGTLAEDFYAKNGFATNIKLAFMYHRLDAG